MLASRLSVSCCITIVTAVTLLALPQPAMGVIKGPSDLWTFTESSVNGGPDSYRIPTQSFLDELVDVVYDEVDNLTHIVYWALPADGSTGPDSLIHRTVDAFGIFSAQNIIDLPSTIVDPHPSIGSVDPRPYGVSIDIDSTGKVGVVAAWVQRWGVDGSSLQRCDLKRFCQGFPDSYDTTHVKTTVFYVEHPFTTGLWNWAGITPAEVFIPGGLTYETGCGTAGPLPQIGCPGDFRNADYILPGLLREDCNCIWVDSAEAIHLSLQFNNSDVPTFAIGYGEDNSISLVQGIVDQCLAPDAAEGKVYVLERHITTMWQPPIVREVEDWAAIRVEIVTGNSVDITSWAAVGGLSLIYDASDVAHVAYSKETLGFDTELRYAKSDATTCFVVNQQIDPNIRAGSTLNGPHSRAKVKMAFEPLTLEPVVAYEARYDVTVENQIRFSDRAGGSWSPWVRITGAVTSDFLAVGDVLIDPLLPGLRHLRVFVYGDTLLGSGILTPKDITGIFFEDALGVSTFDGGLAYTRMDNGSRMWPLGGIDFRVGRPVLVALDRVGDDDDFFWSEANNFYMIIKPQSCAVVTPPLNPVITILDAVTFAVVNDINGVPMTGIAPPRVFPSGSHSTHVLQNILPAGDYELLITATCYIDRTDTTRSGIAEDDAIPFTILYGYPTGTAEIVMSLPLVMPCVDCSGGSCGSAPLYAGAVVLDSFGNAVLPLIPALLALAVWAVARRRKANQ